MLSKWETLFLIMMTLATMGHVVITPLIIDVTGRDGWISILLSLPIAIIFGFTIYRLRLKYPNKAFTEVLKHLLGNIPGKIMIGIFLLYFLFLATFTFGLLIDFVFIAFLPDTPKLAILLWFLIFFIYASIKGIKRMALVASILAIVSVLAGHSITLLNTPMKDWDELRPFLEFGWSPVLWGTLVIISIWIELLLLLFLPIENIKAKRTFWFWTVGIILNTIMMLSTLTGNITIFGLGQASNFVYPALSSVRIISLMFIDRFDIYALLLMCIGSYIRCGLYFRIAFNLSCNKDSSTWKKRILFSMLMIIASIGAYFLAGEHYRLIYALNYYAYTIILFPIPFILLAISRFKKVEIND